MYLVHLTKVKTMAQQRKRGMYGDDTYMYQERTTRHKYSVVRCGKVRAQCSAAECTTISMQGDISHKWKSN